MCSSCRNAEECGLGRGDRRSFLKVLLQSHQVINTDQIDAGVLQLSPEN